MRHYSYNGDTTRFGEMSSPGKQSLLIIFFEYKKLVFYLG